jgi:hypothetical protein
MGPLESLRVQSIQVFKICGKKLDAFLPLILLFFTLATSRVQYGGLRTFLLKLAQCVACPSPILVMGSVLGLFPILDGVFLMFSMNQSQVSPLICTLRSDFEGAD